MSGAGQSALRFDLPPALEAHEPPEARGEARDGVRLMVTTRRDGRLVHARFRDLPRFLDPGDLLVVNTSATVPAAVSVRRQRDGAELELHLSTPAPDDEASGVAVPGSDGEASRVAAPAPDGPTELRWIVELRSGSRPFGGGRAGDVLVLPAGAHAELLAPVASGMRLWLARLELPGPLLAYLHEHACPIRYGYVSEHWPLAAYQNVYALHWGSAEMASAGRPFSPALVTRLVARGVLVAPVVLHTGVSSPERGEPPYAERYQVPAATARLVNAVRGWAGRVVAVGTTVARALESAAAPGGELSPSEGWTRLVIDPERGLWTIDGLLTGWHEPEASHLLLLRAAAGDALLARAYAEALDRGYLWHEFGDSHLVLP